MLQAKLEGLVAAVGLCCYMFVLLHNLHFSFFVAYDSDGVKWKVVLIQGQSKNTSHPEFIHRVGSQRQTLRLRLLRLIPRLR